MRVSRITAAALPMLAALALVAAGCGGGSKNSAATTEAATTTEAAATTEEATTTEAATTEATTTSALGGLVASGKCKDLQNLGQKLSTALNPTGGGQVDLKQEAQALQDFAKDAPSDIKADFQTMADYVSKIADAYPKITPGQTPDAATLQKLQQLGQSLQKDAAKVQTASQNIVAWASKNCRA
ncbi:MAG TPA: hypothetical protein VN449_00455 [Gaiellaceae bacterium]|nr:hypothetical protein [Gaiellaceae bacterium]